MSETKPYRCRRCNWRHDDRNSPEVAAHAWVEPRHPRCTVCSHSLAEHEQQTCAQCVARTRADLADIEHAYAMLPSVIETGAFHSGRTVGGDALVMLVDGSVEGGGPDDWLSDPTPVVAVLESCERDWRHTFGHGPAEHLATVTGCVGYLMRYLDYAAGHHPAFDEYVHEVRQLRSRLLHVAGMADDPETAPAECFDCGGRLVRRYGVNGLDDDWECSRCGRDYDQPSYFLALRAAVDGAESWVTVPAAAVAAHRPLRTLRTWIARFEVESACFVETGSTIFVWWPSVVRRAGRTDTRTVAA